MHKTKPRQHEPPLTHTRNHIQTHAYTHTTHDSSLTSPSPVTTHQHSHQTKDTVESCWWFARSYSVYSSDTTAALATSRLWAGIIRTVAGRVEVDVIQIKLKWW